MTEQSHEAAAALIGAYVLGAVPPEEVPAMRAHTLSCDECMAEADELSETAGSLSLTVEPVAPPLGFTETVLERVQDRSRPSTPSPTSGRWGAARCAFLRGCSDLRGRHGGDRARRP